MSQQLSRPSHAEYVPKSTTGTVHCQRLCSSATHRMRPAWLFTRRLLSLSLHMRTAKLRHSDRSGIPGCALAHPLRSGVSQRQRAPRRSSSQAGLQPPESRAAQRAWLRRLPLGQRMARPNSTQRAVRQWLPQVPSQGLDRSNDTQYASDCCRGHGRVTIRTTGLGTLTCRETGRARATRTHGTCMRST